MISRGTFWQLPTWARLTSVVASSSLPGELLLPTPTATSYGTSLNGSPGDGREDYGDEAGKPSLETMAKTGLLPTPTATMSETKGDLIGYLRGTKGSRMRLPTPNARDAHGPAGKGTRERGGRSACLPSSVRELQEQGGLLPTPTTRDAANSGNRSENAHPGVSLFDVVVAGRLLPTPTASDATTRGQREEDGKRSPALTDVMRGGLLPTPTTSDATSGPGRAMTRTGGENLRTAVTLPTPRARDGKGDGKDCLPRATGAKGYLHPNLVEIMMGLPPSFSDLDGDD